MSRVTFTLPILFLVACGPARTSAREPPGPKFDPAQSDPEALAIADAGVAALGGAEAWDKVQQLSFQVDYKLDGATQALFVHHWDRWNGRHNFRKPDLAAEVASEDDRPWIEVYYDVFDDDVRIHGFYDGKEVDIASAEQMRDEAKTRLLEDVSWLALFYRLHESGVKLSMDGETATTGSACVPSCKRVKVTFDPANGRETFMINYNKDSGRPEILEVARGGGFVGYALEGWTKVGGLEFPTKLQNIGLAGEVVEYSDVKVGSPDESLYIPQVI